VSKLDVPRIADTISRLVHAGKEEKVPSATPLAETSTPDAIELLGKAAALRDQGVLTEEEFQAQKDRLLGKGN
jgi:hypothetical protein